MFGLFKRETPEQKEIRLQREKELDAIYDKAKFEAQKKAAKIAGQQEGMKGKRTFMDRLKDMGDAASKGMGSIEDAIGNPADLHIGETDPVFGNTTRSTRKKTRSKKKQPTVIVINNKEDNDTEEDDAEKRMWDAIY